MKPNRKGQLSSDSLEDLNDTKPVGTWTKAACRSKVAPQLEGRAPNFTSVVSHHYRKRTGENQGVPRVESEP
jgi:hypothetical protein